MSFTRRTFLASAFASSSFAFGAGGAIAKIPFQGHQVLSAYRHPVGKFEVIALSDGMFALPLAMFKADPAEAGKLLEAVGGPKDKVATPVNAFLVNTGDKLVLIDSGAGQLFGPTLGRFAANLKALGVDPASVDVIAMTHLHPDHFGGLFIGEGKIAFPNAELFVADADLKFWLDEAIAAKVPPAMKPLFDQARMTIEPYLAAKKSSIAEDGKEVVPGVTALAAPGHTPGHTMYRVTSGDDTLLIWGDIIHSATLQPSHPDWAIAFDSDQDMAIATRKRVFDMAATDRLMIAGAHVPFPGIGHVVRSGVAYNYVPHFWTPD